MATSYRFTHALYQNFLYDRLLSKRRVLLHRRVGETMERVYAGQHASGRKRAVSLFALGQLKESFAGYAAMRGASQAAGNLEEECRALLGLTTVSYHLRDLAGLELYGQAAMALAECIGNQALAAEAAINWGCYLNVS